MNVNRKKISLFTDLGQEVPSYFNSFWEFVEKSLLRNNVPTSFQIHILVKFR